MTVVPQQYTLHCVSTGDVGYSITLYGNDQQNIVGIVEMESVLENNYTAVTIHMIILLTLLGIHRQSVVDNHSVNQLMVIKCIDVM